MKGKRGVKEKLSEFP